jgi:hypothetical protein
MVIAFANSVPHKESFAAETSSLTTLLRRICLLIACCIRGFHATDLLGLKETLVKWAFIQEIQGIQVFSKVKVKRRPQGLVWDRRHFAYACALGFLGRRPDFIG